MELMKVSASSSPKAVAGAVAAIVAEYGRAEIVAVGAGAVNQAIKGIAIARGFLAPRGIELVVVPSFASIDIEGTERTSIKLVVEAR